MNAGSEADLIELYRCVSRIRSFELKVRELVRSNEIAGVTHEYIGQEAIAAGICRALGEHDYLTSTHRGHGHSIAKGASLTGMFAELLGRPTGLNHGRGGSMHVASLPNGVLGANGMVGGGIPFALGAAWTSKRLELNRVAVAFFGDGGANQGILFECMNLASIWHLPVLFVCENNQYAVTLSAAEAIGGDLLTRAVGFGLRASRADGMNPVAALDHVRPILESVRLGEPAFIEFETYRFVGHHTAEESMGLKYRDDAEIETWRARDPLSQLEGLLSPTVVDQIRREVATEIEDAVQTARAAPIPDPSTAMDYMYATASTVSGENS